MSRHLGDSLALKNLLDPIPCHQDFVGFETVSLEDQEIHKSKKRHEKAMFPDRVCGMCLGLASQGPNKIVECSGCGVGVHRKCYPLPHQAEAQQFVCWTCEKEVQKELCVVCGCVGGLMLPTGVTSDS